MNTERYEEIKKQLTKKMKGEKWGMKKKHEEMLNRIDICMQIKVGVGNGKDKD
jgi:hypothetical protein